MQVVSLRFGSEVGEFDYESVNGYVSYQHPSLTILHFPILILTFSIDCRQMSIPSREANNACETKVEFFSDESLGSNESTLESTCVSDHACPTCDRRLNTPSLSTLNRIAICIKLDDSLEGLSTFSNGRAKWRAMKTNESKS